MSTNIVDISESMIRRALGAHPAERQRLQAARDDYFNRGLHFTRMARKCTETAHECFEEARLIEQQLGVVP